MLAAYPARYFAAWGQRDAEVALELFTSRLSWIDPSLPAEITSRTEARGFFEAAWQGFPDLAFTAVGKPLVDAETGRLLKSELAVEQPTLGGQVTTLYRVDDRFSIAVPSEMRPSRA